MNVDVELSTVLLTPPSINTRAAPEWLPLSDGDVMIRVLQSVVTSDGGMVEVFANDVSDEVMLDWTKSGKSAGEVEKKHVLEYDEN